MSSVKRTMELFRNPAVTLPSHPTVNQTFVNVSGSIEVFGALHAAKVVAHEHLRSIYQRDAVRRAAREKQWQFLWRKGVTWLAHTRMKKGVQSKVVEVKLDKEVDGHLVNTLLLRSTPDLREIILEAENVFDQSLLDTLLLRSTPHLKNITLDKEKCDELDENLDSTLLLRSTPDLKDIILNKEKCEELDSYLDGTLWLRATPTVQCLLDIVAHIDYNLFIDLITKLVLSYGPTDIWRESEPYWTGYWKPAVAVEIANEVREFLDDFPHESTFKTHSSFKITHKPSLSARKNLHFRLDLTDLLNRTDERFAESMLCSKVIEDPSFPCMADANPMKAAWRKDYMRQDFALPEGTDFFVQKFFIEKLLLACEKEGKLPPQGKLKSMWNGACAAFKSRMKDEIEAAELITQQEINLRFRMERYVPMIAVADKDVRALKSVKVDTLEQAGLTTVAEDGEIIALLKAAMKNVLETDNDNEFDEDERLISDIISIYSSDVPIDYWNRKSTLDVVMDSNRRAKIEQWILPPSETVHDLSSSTGGVLEETDVTEEELFQEFLTKSDPWREKGETYTMIVNMDKLGMPELEEDDLPEREAGFYSNMSGLSDLSDLSDTDDDESDSEQETSDSSNSDLCALK